MKKSANKVNLLKDEFQKYAKNESTIGQDGFELIGKDLGIDIYSDVSQCLLLI